MIIDEVSEAVAGTREMLSEYMNDNPEFRTVGTVMLSAWESGLVQYQKL